MNSKCPPRAYYGVQTQRALNNYHISRKKMSDYPDYVIAIAYVKLAAVQTNHQLGVINDEITAAISQACEEIIDGKMHDQFPVDMMQGGAGTSVNMNANEVIANRALEILRTPARRIPVLLSQRPRQLRTINQRRLSHNHPSHHDSNEQIAR